MKTLFEAMVGKSLYNRAPHHLLYYKGPAEMNDAQSQVVSATMSPIMMEMFTYILVCCCCSLLLEPAC